jgi:hypothetical protein
LAIKTDVANHNKMQSKTLNDTKTKNSTNVKPIKKDSQEQLESSRKNAKPIKEDSQ